jgi:hypothetical protein
MHAFIDRIADGVAVILLEGGGRAYVPVSGLPPGSAAGHMLAVTLALVPGPEGVAQAEAAADLIERLRYGEHRHEGTPRRGGTEDASRHG